MRGVVREENERGSEALFKLEQERWFVIHDTVVNKVKRMLDANKGSFMSLLKLRNKIHSNVEGLKNLRTPQFSKCKIELLNQFEDHCKKGFVDALSPSNTSKMHRKNSSTEWS